MSTTKPMPTNPPIKLKNIASNKILQKVGMKFIENFYYENIKCNWYKIEKNNYEINNRNR